MKVIYHRNFEDVYTFDPAAQKGRMEVIRDELKGIYPFVLPQPATLEDLLRAHTPSLVERVKKEGVFDIAALSCGGAIKASEIALSEPSFGLIRPPGHHAGKDFNGGFCYFNNIAVSLLYLRDKKGLKRFLIVDIDLHYGNGTYDIFKDDKDVTFINMEGARGEIYIENLKKSLEALSGTYDMLSVSCGFDCYIKDWGGYLTTEDYRILGAILKDFSKKLSFGRRYALLEGGYYLLDLGKNVKSFLEGFF